MCTVWHVDKYKITFKLVINHWTNEILYHTVVSSCHRLGLSFSTHSRIFFSSEYFHYKTFIHENLLTKLKRQIPGEPLAARYS